MSKKSTAASEMEQQMEVYKIRAKYLQKEGMLNGSYKGEKDVIKALALAESVNIPWMSIGRMIDVIQGNPAISAKVIAGLLTKHGVAIQVVQDWEPVYEEKPTPIMVDDGSGGKKPKMDEYGQVCYYEYDNKPILKKVEIDRITKVIFKRYYPNIGVVDCPVTITQKDAKDAGWLSKHTWKSMPKFLAMARAISRGSRLIGADLTGAVYSTDEVAEFTEGVENIIDNEGNLAVTNAPQAHEAMSKMQMTGLSPTAQA